MVMNWKDGYRCLIVNRIIRIYKSIL